jgi:hypothetical protein
MRGFVVPDSRGSRTADQFLLRLPEGMRDRIRQAAEANGRSMNAEVLATLAEAYPGPEAPDLSAIIEDLQAAESPEDFANRARAANSQLEAAGLPYRVDMVPPFPGKISFSTSPQVPVPAKGETVILSGRTVRKED